MKQLFNQDSAVYIQPPLKKEYYETVYAELMKIGAKSVADIGCASGDFLYFLGDMVERKVGVDKSEELISLAKSRVIDSEFKALDIFDFLKENEKFDAVCMMGTLHTFMEYRQLLRDLVKSTSPKILIIQSVFNIYPIDVRIMHSDANSPEAEFQCAQCLFSIEKLILFLEEMGACVSAKKYQMQGTLLKDQSNPLRVYHIDIDGEKYLTNGTSTILREFIILAKFSLTD